MSQTLTSPKSVAPARGKSAVAARLVPISRILTEPAKEPVKEPAGPGLLSWCRLLRVAGDETVLPVGCRLTDERRPGRYCFLLLDGAAVAEVAGQHIATFSAGSFVGSLDDCGGPSPLPGITVRVIEPVHVLVLDARKLAMLLDSDRALFGAWLRHKPADSPRRNQLRLAAMSKAAM
jgi:hypothetical protein